MSKYTRIIKFKIAEGVGWDNCNILIYWGEPQLHRNWFRRVIIISSCTKFAHFFYLFTFKNQSQMNFWAGFPLIKNHSETMERKPSSFSTISTSEIFIWLAIAFYKIKIKIWMNALKTFPIFIFEVKVLGWTQKLYSIQKLGIDSIILNPIRI